MGRTTITYIYIFYASISFRSSFSLSLSLCCCSCQLVIIKCHILALQESLFCSSLVSIFLFVRSLICKQHPPLATLNFHPNNDFNRVLHKRVDLRYKNDISTNFIYSRRAIFFCHSTKLIIPSHSLKLFVFMLIMFTAISRTVSSAT